MAKQPQMTSFTPGPWRLGPQHKDTSFAIHAEKASVMRLVPFGSSIAQAEANARLIAASPELFAVLQDIVAHGEGAGETDSPLMARARDAIAKATGAA